MKAAYNKLCYFLLKFMIYVFFSFYIFCPYVKHPKSITTVNNKKLCAKQIKPCMGCSPERVIMK